MQKTNQAYVLVAQAYIHTPCMQIGEPWAGGIWFVFCIRLNIFTSKISDLLLFFRADGDRGCESWYTIKWGKE